MGREIAVGRHSAPTKRELRERASAGRQRSPWQIPGSASGRLIAAGAGVAVLSATVGFMSLSKQIEVVVDGRAATVTTYASDVRGALVDAGVTVAKHDAVTPAPASALIDGATISVTKARKLTVTVDGTQTTKYVAALTTAEAVQQLGLTDHAVVSSRSGRLPLTGGDVELATYRPVTISADGQQHTVFTAAQTVGDALADAGVTMGETDQSTPAEGEPVTEGMTINVSRIGEHTITEQRPIPHQVVEQADPTQYVGINDVKTTGADGVETVTVVVSMVDGVETARTEVATQVTTAPVDELTLKGAKQFPADVDALNWKSLGMCESTNNPKAVNKTNGKYFGEYQFSVETWAGVGGTGNPADASAEEQLARAKILFMKYGASQWECGSHLYD